MQIPGESEISDHSAKLSITLWALMRSSIDPHLAFLRTGIIVMGEQRRPIKRSPECQDF
jgi:hypothetical protein